MFPTSNNCDLENTTDTRVHLEAYNGSKIKQFAKCEVKLTLKSKTITTDFFAAAHHKTWVGLLPAEALGLLTVNVYNTAMTVGTGDSED